MLLDEELSSDASQPSAAIVGLSRIAVLVPCTNREVANGKVVADFRAALPDATVCIYDNNSTDRTIEAAAKAGAMVRRETHQGKGRLVRRMLTDVDADNYVLVDGDATCDAERRRS
jgi:glycosyltransferase involved in cell wall biosynthesis